MSARTEMELIVDLHRGTDRQGPGSEKDTLTALQFMDVPTGRTLQLADIGCGTGGQTLTLARNLNCQITAVDLFPEFLDELSEKSEDSGVESTIATLQHSMDDLPFGSEELDIIWSEGAIYILGFENGIQQWKKFIKKDGFLAVSEITWKTSSRPIEIEEYWRRQYPEIDTASNKIKVLEANGFTLMGYFMLSKDRWMQSYYKPLEARFSDFLKRHDNSELARKVVHEYESEIKMYKKFGDHYSYGFYIAKKTR